MSNSFNISVAPEIAALKADTADIRTDVTAIHDTDLPAVETKIDIIDTTVDALRAVDVPILSGKLDTIDTEIGVIDGIADAIKLKTDLIPQKVRGNFSIYRHGMGADTFEDVCSITGQGKLYSLICWVENAGDGVEILITIDGVLSNIIQHTGDLIKQHIFCTEEDAASDKFEISKLPFSATQPHLLNLEFDTSLHIQVRRYVGSTTWVAAKAIIFEDTF